MEVEDPVVVMIFDVPVGITEEEGEGWREWNRERGGGSRRAGGNMTKRTGGPSICNISKVSGTRSGFGKRVNWVFWQFLCPSVIGLAFVCF